MDKDIYLAIGSVLAIVMIFGGLWSIMAGIEEPSKSLFGIPFMIPFVIWALHAAFKSKRSKE